MNKESAVKNFTILPELLLPYGVMISKDGTISEINHNPDVDIIPNASTVLCTLMQDDSYIKAFNKFKKFVKREYNREKLYLKKKKLGRKM